jgi:hypothetical protein
MAEVSPDESEERGVGDAAVTLGLGAELRGAVGDEEGIEVAVVHSGLLGWVAADNVMTTMSCDTPPHIRRTQRFARLGALPAAPGALAGTQAAAGVSVPADSGE